MHSDFIAETRNLHIDSRRPINAHSNVGVNDVKGYQPNDLSKNRSPVHSTNVHLSPMHSNMYTTSTNYVQPNMAPIVTSFNIAADNNNALSPRSNVPYTNLYRS